jgi:hypothetical protein
VSSGGDVTTRSSRIAASADSGATPTVTATRPRRPVQTDVSVRPMFRRSVADDSSGSDRRSDLDQQLLASDVELAEVGLLEKRAELEIGRKDNIDSSRLKLAELAVRRAEIELSRAKLRLEASRSADSRQ